MADDNSTVASSGAEDGRAHSDQVGPTAPAPGSSAPTVVAAAPADDPGRLQKKLNSFTNWLIGAGVGWAALAAFMVIVFGVGADHPWQVFIVAAAISAAAGALGGTIGFLFGVPRVLTGTGTEIKRQTEGRIESNSNLEQISDWLTKIVVGVGLTQIYKIPGALGRLGAAMAPGLGGQQASGPFAVALVLYAFFLAFLIVYMWTRTRFLEVLQLFTQSAKDAVETGRRSKSG